MRIDYPRAGRTGVRRFLPSWRQWLLLAGVGLVALAGLFVQMYRAADVSLVVPPQATTVYYGDGETPIARFGENRTVVPLSDVPQHLQDAVLAAEDRDFYSHNGFSVTGIARAAWKQLTGGSRQGGSTITQQYAKNAYLTQERTFERKLKELVLSVKLDRTRSKPQILEDYLNTIYFGRGAYGVQAASEAYFRKPVSDLNVRQAAVIAAILRSPESLYNPDTENGRERLKERWAYVLDAMVDEGTLSAEKREGMTFPKIAKRKSFASMSGPSGYLVDMVKQELASIDGFDEERLAQGGLEIITTFDQEAQEAAVRAVEDGLPETNSKGVRAGLVSIDVRSGGIIALYGGEDYAKQYNAATLGRAQAGSTFKPFGLVAALRDGVSLSDTFDGSSPKKYTLPDGSTYPATGQGIVNFGGASYGRVSLLTATQKSINTAYVELNLQVGPDELIDVAERAGLPEDTPGLQESQGNNVLGFASPRVIDMATAYATFAGEGMRPQRHVIQEVRGSNGGVLYRAPRERERVLPADVMAEANYALQQVVQAGTATTARSLGRPVAGKTGTTNDSKAAWFVGYTPQVVTAVGVYREDGKGRPQSLNGLGGNYNVTGGSFPLSIWTSFMRTALAGLPVEQFTRPAGRVSPPSATATGSPTRSKKATGSSTPTSSPTTSAPSPTASVSRTASSTPTSAPSTSSTSTAEDEDESAGLRAPSSARPR